MDKHILNDIDPKILGARLQEARKARGVRQQDVAAEMEIARTTLVAIEKGERRVSPEELIRFAAYYGRTVSDFVSRQIVSESFVPQFRSTWRADIEQDLGLAQVAAELQRLGEDYEELERLCQAPSPKSYPPPYDTRGLTPEQAAQDIADAERNRLGIGDGPVTSLRERLENDFGLRIFYFPMPPKISGLFACNDLLGACIGINANHPRDRRTWSLAHECGHFLTNRYRAEITFLSEKKRQSASERMADAFAENFLMSASGLNRRFSELVRSNQGGNITLAQLCALADLYQISVQAMILRLENLERLPSGTWYSLEAQGFKPQKAKQLLGLEVNPSEEYLLPKRYLNLAAMARERSLVTEGQLARFLRVDRVSARALVEHIIHRFNAESDSGYESIELDLSQSLAGK